MEFGPSVCTQSCLHSLIERLATLIPDTEVVCAWEGTFTYSELSKLSTRVAEYLVALGTVHGGFVLFAFEKSR